jgi:16S rRNA (uracil1498-N3)-methyltransferase
MKSVSSETLFSSKEDVMSQRYFLNEKSNFITGQDAHHIKKVMRMTTGEEIIVCYESDCFLVSINVEQEDVYFTIINKLSSKKGVDVTLIQGLPKGSKTETVVKYATMFGASHIVFLEMNRSIAKVDNENSKIKRLSTIAKEAAELSHRFNLPKISFEKKLENIDLNAFDLILLADENHLTTSLEDVIKEEHLTKKIALIIGPEGGITDIERNYLAKHKAIFISLGHLILPTEVASLYALSYLSIKNS